MATTIRDIAARFNSPSLTGEQTERLQAIRQASAGLAACIFQAVADCGERERALAGVDEAFAFVRLAIERESPTPGRDGVADRLAIMAKAEDALTPSVFARLRAFIGIIDQPPELGDKKKKAKED